MIDGFRSYGEMDIMLGDAPITIHIGKTVHSKRDYALYTTFANQNNGIYVAKIKPKNLKHILENSFNIVPTYPELLENQPNSCIVHEHLGILHGPKLDLSHKDIYPSIEPEIGRANLESFGAYLREQRKHMGGYSGIFKALKVEHNREELARRWAEVNSEVIRLERQLQFGNKGFYEKLKYCLDCEKYWLDVGKLRKFSDELQREVPEEVEQKNCPGCIDEVISVAN